MPKLIEDEILVACSRLHFDEEQRDRATSACGRGDVDWGLLYSAAVAHQVAPLVYRNLRSSESLEAVIPVDVAEKFRDVSRRNALKNAMAPGGIAAMAAYFDGHAHDVLLLKHVAFFVFMRDLYELTMAQDADVVVRPREAAGDRDGGRYLWSNYKKSDATWSLIDDYVARNDPRWRHVGIEVDNRLHHDVVWNGVLAIDFRRVWGDALRHRLEDRVVYTPDVHDLLIISSVNMHRKPRPRVRDLVQIHELVRREKDLDWERLARKVHAYRCNSLVYSALLATKSVMGCEMPQAGLRGLMKPGLKGRAISLLNRDVSPAACCTPPAASVHHLGLDRGLGDVARRALALSLPQLLRFVVFRLVMSRLLGLR